MNNGNGNVGIINAMDHSMLAAISSVNLANGVNPLVSGWQQAAAAAAAGKYGNCKQFES